MKITQPGRTLAVACAALIAAILGLVVSVHVNGPGPLLTTASGRWLAERIASNNVPAGTHAPIEGDVIGPLALTDFKGQRRSLPDVRGRRMVVNVWASWCVPCRDEMPLLQAFATSQPANGTAMVGIAQDDPGSVANYLRLTAVNYPIFFDDAQGRAGIELGDRLGVLPYTALIDGDGRLLRRKYGPFANASALAEWAAAP